VKGINLGVIESCINDVPLSAIDQDIINRVLKKIKNAYGKYCIPINQDFN